MGWKDEIAAIREQQDIIENLIRMVQGQVVLNNRRIEAMQTLLGNQIKNQSRSADRMADRMIEMAMVNSGRSIEAASHRRTLDEKPTEGADLWQDSPNTQWPPPGCDAVQMP